MGRWSGPQWWEWASSGDWKPSWQTRGRGGGGARGRNKWNHQPYVSCQCGNWSFTKDLGADRLCSECHKPYPEESQEHGKNAPKQQAAAAPTTPELGDVLDKLSQLLGLDVRDKLIDHLPKPTKIEEKEATEPEMWKQVRAARGSHEKAAEKAKKAAKELAKAEEVFKAATAKAEQADKDEAEAATHLAEHKAKYFEAFPGNKGRHDLFEETRKGGERKRAKGPDEGGHEEEEEPEEPDPDADMLAQGQAAEAAAQQQQQEDQDQEAHVWSQRPDMHTEDPMGGTGLLHSQAPGTGKAPKAKPGRPTPYEDQPRL